MREFQKELTACMQDDPPPCASVCPFGLDVRDFIGKLKRGSFGAAYRAYANAVGFPAIVSRLCPQPCKGECVFTGNIGAVDLQALEAAAVAYTPNALPNRYNLPAKTQKVAVIGAGPSGLACALRLAAKMYPVVIFEREERTGGSLWDHLAPEVFQPELERQFMYVQPTFRLGEEIRDLSQIEADAVYIATGAGGTDFGQKPSGKGAFASVTPGVFLGGGLTGRGPVAAIADGLFASLAVERYLKTDGMNEPIRNFTTRFHPDPALYPSVPPVVPRGERLSKEEAIAEADRCQQCRCDACVRCCDLMRGYRKYPKRIEEEVVITIDPVSLSRNARVATRLISTCNHCGLCKQVCPVHIDTGAYLLESHRKMVEKNAMPWAFHEFWLRDMAFSNGEASVCLIPERPERSERIEGIEGIESPKSLFFPGCRLGGSDPRLVLESYRALRAIEPSSAIFLSCCGAPAAWAGEKALHDEAIQHLRETWENLGRPTVVFACMNCRKEFAAYLPEVEGVSLYELLQQNGHVPRQLETARVSVFDPCASRDFPDTQKAVRNLVEDTGCTLEPLSREGKYAQCCGWGGQVELANPGYADSVARMRAEEGTLPYLVYCANCRDVFARKGKPAAHILEVLFPEVGGPRWDRPAPTATESRENRRSLRRELLQEFGQEETFHMPIQPNTALLIPSELLEKMGRDYILREDVESAVRACEDSGEFLENLEKGTRLGHVPVGRMTLWVEYRNLEGCRELVNAYAHRMRIAEGNGSV